MGYTYKVGYIHRIRYIYGKRHRYTERNTYRIEYIYGGEHCGGGTYTEWNIWRKIHLEEDIHGGRTHGDRHIQRGTNMEDTYGEIHRGRHIGKIYIEGHIGRTNTGRHVHLPDIQEIKRKSICNLC